MKRAGVYAVVITFQPDLLSLRQLLLACLPQVAGLVVVDNGSGALIQASLHRQCADSQFEVLALDGNVGVAAAQNKGIAWARQRGCSHVLFFDQDSVPAPDMVARLMAGLNCSSSSNLLIAAVGPRLVDRRTGSSTPFVYFGALGVTRKTFEKGVAGQSVETDFLVSSGMLIPLAVLDQVGQLEEGLFIDNVDLEWCFRARSIGFCLLGVNDAVMQHSVGDRVIEWRGHVIYLHQPSRQYYIMRNRILLYQRSYTPWNWIIQDSARMLFKLMAFSLFVAPRGKNFLMMIKGIRDGLTGNIGKLL